MTAHVLTSFQRRLWFADQRDGIGATQTIPSALRLRGPLDRQALAGAVREVYRRHPVLGARIVLGDGGGPVQILDEPDEGNPAASPPDPGELDVPAPEPGQDEEQVLERAREIVATPMVLDGGVLARFVLLEISSEDHLLVLPVHHIVCDGVGLRSLQRDLLACYEAIRRGTPMPAAPRTFPDVGGVGGVGGGIYDTGAVSEVAESLRGAPDVTELPLDRPRPARPTFRGFVVETELPKPVVDAVRALAASARVSPFMIYTAATHLLLGHYGGGTDSVLGFTAANRTAPERREVVGPLANTLPVRVYWDDDPPVTAFVTRVRDAVLGVAGQGELPLEDVVDALDLPRDLRRHPVFQVLVNHFELGPDGPGPDGLDVEGMLLDSGSAWIDLELDVRSGHRGSCLQLRCNADLFDRETGRRILGHLTRLLNRMGADPTARVTTLSPLDDAERTAVIEAGRGPVVAEARAGTLTGLLNAALDEHADQVAVAGDEGILSYTELADRARALAAGLRSRGVRAEVPVGLCGWRAHDLVVGAVGIVLAGGVYLPLDPDHPPRRRADMVATAGAPLVLTGEGTDDLATEVGDGMSVLGVREAEQRADGDGDGRADEVGGDHAAYILFTSGSTGEPKGVTNTHRGIHNRLWWMQEHYRIGPGDSVLQKTPVSFDVSVWELFWPLVQGARLVLARPDGHRDPEYLRDLVAREGVTVMHFVPSMLRAFLAAGFPAEHRLRHVVCSGEALSPELAEATLAASGTRLHNLYGPTEAAIDVTTCECVPGLTGVGGGTPIGRAVTNTGLRVLGLNGDVVPFGVLGELYIAGAQLARGYAGRDDLTAERFAEAPTPPAERLYRTGDLARLRPDGTLEYAGRGDRQLKIRGFRIEPGEIEVAAERLPGVAQAVVTTIGEGDRRRLVLHLVPHADTGHDSELDGSRVRDALARVLPEHMVPVACRVDADLPVTTSGKIDHAALPEISIGPGPAGSDSPVAASGAVEHALAEAVAAVLDHPRTAAIDVTESFFTLGGDSIRSIELAVAARARDVHITVEEIFAYRSVRELARVARRGVDIPTGAGVGAGRYPLSALLRGLVVESWRHPEYRSYATALEVQGPLDEAYLRDALARAMHRHPFLRSSVHASDETHPVQVVHEHLAPPLVVDDVRDDTDLAATVAEASGTRFDWTAPPLLSLRALRLDEDRFRIVLVEPFLDGWSATLVVTEILDDYEALLAGRTLPAVWPRDVLGDFVDTERRALENGAARAFWADRVASAAATTPPRHSDDGLPTGGPRTVVLPEEVHDGLHELAARCGAPLKSVLLAAHLRALATLTGQVDVTSGVMANARPENPDGSEAVGLFLNTTLVGVRTDQSSWAELVEEVRAAEAATLLHRAYPYAQVLHDHDTDRIAEATFNYTHFRPYRRVGEHGLLTVVGREANDQTYLPLTAQFHQDAITGTLRYRLEFVGDGFPGWHRDRIAELYRTVLAAMAGDPDAPPRRGVAGTTELAGATPEAPATIGEHFRAVAERLAGSEALRADGTSWTYNDLRGRVAGLAERLADLGVAHGDTVGVCAPRGPGLVVALLAVTSIGAVYTPLDPTTPPDRGACAVERAGARVVVVDPATRDAVPAGPVLIEATGRSPNPPPEAVVDPEDVAVLMFTSGSTGEPRGVELSHRAIDNRLRWGWRALPFADGDVVGARTPIGFVDSLNELLAGLLSGVPTALLPDTAEPRRLLDGIAEHGVTRLVIVPSLVDEILRLDDDPTVGTVRHWVLSGEPLSTATATALRRRHPDAVITNLYGSTEVAGDATAYRVDGTEAGVGIPIGTPIDGATVTVLDPWDESSPPGCVGEIVVAGRPVAHGYRGEPAGDGQFGRAEDGTRTYRTGDLGTVVGGALHHAGRADRQLKRNGVRIEPVAVEIVLREQTGVDDAVVEPAPGDGALVAHLVLGAGAAPPEAEMRRAVAATVGAAAVPARFVRHAGWPRTPSGKLDRRALRRTNDEPADDSSGEHGADGAPASLAERELAALWEDRLGVRPTTRGDDFFAMGGNSLHAILLARLLQDRFGVALTLVDMFTHSTLAEQAEALERRVLDDDRHATTS